MYCHAEQCGLWHKRNKNHQGHQQQIAEHGLQSCWHNVAAFKAKYKLGALYQEIGKQQVPESVCVLVWLLACWLADKLLNQISIK